MTIIEGLGDEVTILFTTILAILVVFFIFWIKDIVNVAVWRRRFESDQGRNANNEILEHSNNTFGNANLNSSPNESPELSGDNLSCDNSAPLEAAEVSSREHPDVNQPVISPINETVLDGNATEIRIQYVDGRQRHVIASLDDTIGNFKRENFSQELGVGEMVRLIACGRELRDEGATLRNAGLNNNGVLHCLITIPPTTNTQQQQQDVGGQTVGRLLVPLLCVMLSLLWYIRLVYRSAFTGLSTFLLAAITTIFLVILSLNITRQLSPRPNPRPHQL